MTSTLRRARDLLRPMVSLSCEYRVRRLALSVLPTSGPQQAAACYVHACAWKTASQWVRLILSDPRIYRHTGCMPYVYALVAQNPPEAARYAAQKRSILLAAYAGADEVESLAGAGTLKAFFVVRDPRDMLVSWYYSTRFTHDPTPGVDAHRAAMEEMSDSAAFGYCADAFVAEFAPILDGWAARAGSAKIVKFEDLTGPKTAAHWDDLLRYLGAEVPVATRDAVLATYAMKNLAPAETGDARTDKYAARGKRSWPELLDPAEDARIQGLLRGWRTAFGYGEA